MDDSKMPEMKVFGGLPPDAEAAWQELDKEFNPNSPELVKRRHLMDEEIAQQKVERNLKAILNKK